MSTCGGAPHPDGMTVDGSALGGTLAPGETACVLRGARAVGKTTALRRIAQRAVERDVSVLWAAGDPAEINVRGGLLEQLTPRAMGSVERSDPAALWRVVAGNSPVVLLIDDAHWADERSAGLLAQLVRRCASDWVWLVFAADARAVLPAALSRLPQRELSGVDAAGAEVIVPTATPAVRAELMRLTRANPLALREFADSLSTDQLAGTAPLPRRVRLGRRGCAVFAPDWAVLDGPARTWLLLLAWGPLEFDVCARAAAVLGLGTADLAPAERAGVVHGAHWDEPLSAAAVRQAASTAETERVCAALVSVLDADEWPVARARALGAAVSDPGRVAGQLAAATVPLATSGHLPDAHAAAVRAAELAPARAERDRYRIVAAELAWLAGYSEHALRLLDRARPQGADARTSAAVIRAVIHGFRDSWTNGWWLLNTEPGTNPGSAEHTLRLLVTAINAGWHTVSVESLQRTVERLRGGLRPGFDVAVGALQHVLSGRSDPEPEQREALCELAWWANPSDALHPKSWPPPLLPMFLGEEDRYARLFSTLLDSEPVRGAPSTRALLLLKSATAETPLGNWDRAVQRAREGARLADDLGHHALRADLVLCAAWIAGARGAEQECLRLVDTAAEGTESATAVHELTMPRWVRGIAALSSGRPTEAHEYLRGVLHEAATPQRVVLRRLATVDFVDAAVRAGARREAAAATADFARWVEAGAASWAWLDLALCRALVDEDNAQPWYEHTLRLCAETGRASITARTELRYGSWLRRNRGEQRAREYLRSAETRFGQLGAEAWSRSAHAELRATGEAHQPGARAELTPQEREIALLAAEGCTNRQIAAKLSLSPRTVGYHLYKVFPKLDITSRTQLASVLWQ